MLTYGIDWDGPMPEFEDKEVAHVVIPDIACPLFPEEYDELQHTILPSSESTKYGIDLYTAVLAFVEDKL